MASLADAITRALQKQKDEQKLEDSQKTPEQLAQDEENKKAYYAQAKAKLGYGSQTPN